MMPFIRLRKILSTPSLPAIPVMEVLLKSEEADLEPDGMWSVRGLQVSPAFLDINVVFLAFWERSQTFIHWIYEFSSPLQ